MNDAIKTAKTSALALWSLILGIASLTCFGMLTGLPAIICGFMAKSRIRESNGELQGGGLALGGLITGFVGTILTTLAVLGILAGMLLPAVATARDRARRAACMSNLSQIGKASMLYSMENNNQRPSNFQDLKSYVEDTPQLFVSPITGNQAGDFSEVDSWTDYILVPNLTEESSAVSVFVFTKPGCYPRGGGQILFLDGSVQWCNQDEYERLTTNLMKVETQ